MIFSEQWLREWVNPKMNTQELMDELTMAGLEVDGRSSVANAFSGVVVGEITALNKHPDADKLNVCSVTDGESEFQVVCGAPNVRLGLKAPFATLGAEIVVEGSKPFKIKKAKLRGVESQGMLCSADELGIGENADGLMELPESAEVGKNLREYLQLDDSSIELDLTPNRGDCLGMVGLAREVGVLARNAVQEPQISCVAATCTDTFSVDITAQQQCPRYLGRVIRNINLHSQSPLWMQEKLRRSGLRSIDPIVDVTNFVLMELGQPMHAFDLAKLKGGINVRMANDKESLVLLDGKEVELTADTLVIADSEKAVAMAGIMGGLNTAVSDETQDVFLECAFFAPLAVASKARSYGMHTDASHRYERGVDYNLQQRAMERATELLLSIVGGEAGPVVQAIGELPQEVKVQLRYANVNKLLGISMPVTEVNEILERLGFILKDVSADSVTVLVPSFRFDVSLEADLIEELARIFGYNNLPKTQGMISQTLKARPEGQLSAGHFKRQLVAQGYQEAITYSFIAPELASLICPDVVPIHVQNPISQDMSIMRNSLLPGLISTLKYNENRQQERIRLFESGLVFNSTSDQPRRLAGLISGLKLPKSWSSSNETVDFYDVKGDVEALLSLSGKLEEFTFVADSTGCFHSGQCARIQRGAEVVGHVGALHPAIQRDLDINHKVYLFELSLSAILNKGIPKATGLSVYPEVSRDLAVVIDRNTAASELLRVVRDNAGEYLKDLRIFDVYQGDAIEKNQKSIALGLTWQHPSRTLNDDDINSIISNCVKALEVTFNANLRN